MKVMIDIGHPADFLLIKNFLKLWEKSDNEYFLTIRDKEVTKELVEAEGFKYLALGKPKEKPLGKVLGVFTFGYKLLKSSKSFNPDIFLSHGSVYLLVVSFITRIPHISFYANDSVASWHNQLIKYLSICILTPSSVKVDFGEKQVRYPGNHELAYLHPMIYKPNQNINNYEIFNKKYVLLRFVSWNSIDDIGKKGFTDEQKVALVEKLKDRYNIFITSETELPQKLSKYKLEIPAYLFQDVLYNAHFVLGESGSVASEAAVLGTPSIYFSSKKIGFLKELEDVGLCFCPHNFVEVINNINYLENLDQIKQIFSLRLKKYLESKINVTNFIFWFLLNFPESYTLFLNNSEKIYEEYK